jgi:hypothetical protein
MKSASLITEALKRSTAEVVEEQHTLRQCQAVISNSELACFRMFEVSLDLQLGHQMQSVEDTALDSKPYRGRCLM